MTSKGEKRGPYRKTAVSDLKLVGDVRKCRVEERIRNEIHLDYESSLPKPPFLSEMASIYWDEIVPELQRNKIISLVDQTFLIILCEEYAQMRRSYLEYQKLPYDDDGKPSAHYQQFVKHSKRLEDLLKECGMTPASRHKVNAVVSVEKDVINEWKAL